MNILALERTIINFKNAVDNFSYFTPTASTLSLEADARLGNWYCQSYGKEGATGFFERVGKTLIIAPINLSIAAVNITAGVIYDFTLAAFWSLASLFTAFQYTNINFNAAAHLRSLGDAPSSALNHIIGCIPELYFRNMGSQIGQYMARGEIVVKGFEKDWKI